MPSHPAGTAFIETAVFTRELEGLYRAHVLDPEGYRLFQVALHEGSTRTDAVQGVPGLYNARWRTRGGGKRGGLRVLYAVCACSTTTASGAACSTSCSCTRSQTGKASRRASARAWPGW